MQKDFHFYTIYTLCRVAGFNDESAKVVAYASQYTDDAKYEGILSFRNGGRYRQVMTAHKFLDFGALSKETFYNIFVPFHFLPGAHNPLVPFHFLPGSTEENKNFSEKLVCQANSDVAQEMIQEIFRHQDKPYFLHRLGIALHTYADTWTHQNFSGILSEENVIANIEAEDRATSSLEQFDEAWIHVASDFIPAIGHGKAGNLPDIPYKKWRYENYKGQVIEVDNVERFLEASKYIYQILCRVTSERKLQLWEKIENKLKKAFQFEGNLEERIYAWKIWIKKGVFYFKSSAVDYDEDTWFHEAVEVVDQHKGIYRRKENFVISNWRYFHDAAIIQRFYILNELLPKYDIFCA